MIFNATSGKNPYGGYGAIFVTYPATWTCYIVDSNNSNRIDSTSNNGSYIFYVPFADEWTVIATNGIIQDKEVVSITASNRSARVAFYERYSIPINNLMWTGVSSYGDEYFEIGEHSVTAKLPETTTENNGYTTCYTIDPIDLTGYSSVRVHVVQVNRNPQGSGTQCSVGIALSPVTTYNGIILGRLNPGTGDDFTFDISSRVGEYRLQVVISHGNSYGELGITPLIRVDEIVLIP